MKANIQDMFTALTECSKVAKTAKNEFSRKEFVDNVVLENDLDYLKLSVMGENSVRLNVKVDTVDNNNPFRTSMKLSALMKIFKPDNKKDAKNISIDIENNYRAKCQNGKINCSVVTSSSILPVDSNSYNPLAVINAKQLHNSLEFVLKAMSSVIGRENLRTVRFDQGKLVATDGHRLHSSQLDFETEPFSLPAVAAHSLYRLSKLCSSVNVFKRDEKNLMFQASIIGYSGRIVFELNVPLPDSVYPSYKQVIPNSFDNHYTIDTKSFVKQLTKLCKVASNPDQIVLEMKGDNLKVVCRDKDHNDFDTSFPIEDSLLMKEVRVGVNPSYLLESLHNSETHKVSIIDTYSPILVELDTNGEQFAIVMPRKIEN